MAKSTSIIARVATLHLIGIGALLVLATHAQAQAVRKCSVDGRAVFQSAPCAIEPRAGATALAAAPAASAPGVRKKTLAEMLHERDADDRLRPVSRPLQADGATVLRARMGAL